MICDFFLMNPKTTTKMDSTTGKPKTWYMKETFGMERWRLIAGIAMSVLFVIICFLIFGLPFILEETRPVKELKKSDSGGVPPLNV
jgi:putative exporter of polyketide antibiotics